MVSWFQNDKKNRQPPPFCAAKKGQNLRLMIPNVASGLMEKPYPKWMRTNGTHIWDFSIIYGNIIVYGI